MKKGTQQGFTILEVALGIFIVVVMLMLYQAALNSVFLTKNAKDQEIALRIASHKIEEIRAGGYASVPSSGSFSDSLLSTIPSGSANLEVATFNAKTKQITVTVSWQEINAQTVHSVSLDTLITEVGGL